jgi:hypothetical protein
LHDLRFRRWDSCIRVRIRVGEMGWLGVWSSTASVSIYEAFTTQFVWIILFSHFFILIWQSWAWFNFASSFEFFLDVSIGSDI